MNDCRVTFGFFTRSGGVSSKPFNTLNCSFNVGDDVKNVRKNLKIVKNELGLNCIVGLNQIHSSKVFILENEDNNNTYKKADGIVTNLRGIGLSILGADCAPILFYDNICNIIGACHAGWRGAIKNIIESTITKMENIGSDRKNIRAIIGPTIQKKNYLIREDVATQVRQSLFYKKNKSILFSKNKNEYYFDLPLLLKVNLECSNINKFSDLNIDTYSNPDLFFSHRRCTHLAFNDVVKTGRHISVIGIIK